MKNKEAEEGFFRQPKKEKRTNNRFFSIIREIIALLFWVYIPIKLFVFDIDVFLVNKYLPKFVWLLNFKFFILIGTIAVFILVIKNKNFLPWFLYIFFYPIIILFWKIPLFVFKQKSWTFAFALINAGISFFKSIKYNFIIATLFLISFAIVFSSSNEKLLWLAIFTLFILILLTYVNRFIFVFKPSSIFQIYIKIFSVIKNYGIKQPTLFALEESIKNLPIEDLNQDQIIKRTNNLQFSVLFNRICLFVGKKLKDYQSSGINVVSYTLSILLLIFLTIFSFGLINLGLFKISNEFFNFSTVPHFFTFFYYSFNNLIFNSIKEITPVMPIAQIVFMAEAFLAFFVGVIFVSLVLSIKSQRYAEELNKAIESIEAQGMGMEGFIKDEYKINNINDAMVELEKLKAGFLKFIYKITENLK